jgi:hypothetical protein
MVESLQRKTQSLNYLPYLLDELGSTPSESSKEATKQILSSLESKEPLHPDKLPGKNSRKAVEDNKVSFDKVSFDDIADRLPSYAPVVVEISDSLVDVIATPDRRLRDDIKKAVDEVRRDLYRRFGVLAPGVRFRPLWKEASYDSFQILFLDQRVVLRRIAPQGDSNGSAVVTPGLAVKTILEKLRSQLGDSRQWLITADTVDQLLSGLGDAFAPVRNWLNEQYTQTDLKLLLRAVLRPDNDSAATIRRAPWLLGSLVFWTAFDDTSDVQTLASYLLDTQRALGNPATLVRPEQSVSSFVETGLDHLRGGDLHEAVEAFRQAKERDPDGAKEAFLRLYTKMYIQEYPEQLAKICGLPRPGNATQPTRLSQQQLWDVQDYLAAEQGEEQPHRADLQLCLMRGYSFAEDRENADVVLRQLLNKSKQKPLSPANLYLVGYYILSGKYDLSPGEKDREQASTLLRSSFNGMELTDIERGFEELLQACRSHSPLLSCLQLLESLADVNDNSFEIPFKLAQAYLDTANSEQAKAALRLLNRADTHLATTFNKGDDQRAWLALEQARANLMMGARGDGEALQKAGKPLQALREDGSLEHMKLADADKGFEELLEACRSPPYGLACLKRVRTLSSMHKDSFWIPFGLASALLDNFMTFKEAQETLVLLDLATLNIAAARKSTSSLQAWLDFLKARAYLVLGANGEQSALPEARKLLEKIIGNTSLKQGDFQLPDAWKYLAQTWDLSGDSGKMAATLEKALKRWPSNDDLKLSRNLFSKDPGFAWADAKEQLTNRDNLSDDIRAMWLFSASFNGLITGATGHEEYVDAFLKTNHEFRDYIRMLQYWRKGADEGAKKLLDTRWDEITKSASNWDDRLALGDASVWREKLIGCYHDDVTCPDIFDALEDEAKFGQSAFAALGLPLRALQCDAYFYDALRQHVTGDPATRDARYRASLRKVLDTGYASYVEYYLATYLLDRLEQGKSSHAASGAPWSSHAK